MTSKAENATVCPICRETARSILVSFENYRIDQCRRCNVGILNPMPGLHELKKLYDKAYFEDQYDEGLAPTSADFPHRISLEAHRVRLFRRFKKRGALLDLGCGLGYFMHACRQAGYAVHGADISESATQYVREELSIPMTTGSLNDLEFPAASFDIVTMWHFLEHTPDPSFCLQKVAGWLKPNGIVAMEVPNYSGTDAKYSRADWVGWKIPFHLYHFNPASLAFLLSKYGFKIVRKRSFHSEYIKLKLGKIPVLNLFARTIARFYSGTTIAVVARRPH